MRESIDVVIVGGGQAGLSTSHELRSLGVEHVVFERGRIAQSWRGRWDAFTLVTPNNTIRMPGGEYAGDDPDGFLPRDEIVAHFDRYAESFAAPVREGVEVTGLDRAESGEFVLSTAGDEIGARTVVLATGAFQKPHRPKAAAGFPPGLLVLDAESYTNPQALPPGRVLVVGSAQTGCQIAEDLHLAGRDVVVACGKAPWSPRRLEGRDIVNWLEETPFMDQTLEQLGPAARLAANVQTTGRDGGHDLNYRVLQRMGVLLTGRLRAVEGGMAHFADDLAESVAFGDEKYAQTCRLISDSCARLGRPAPEMPAPAPFTAHPPTSLPLAGFGAVVITSGFRPDYASWVHLPQCFDDWGFPIQRDGRSPVDGLYFVGVHFMRRRISSFLFGIAADAAVVAGQVAARAGVAANTPA